MALALQAEFEFEWQRYYFTFWESATSQSDLSWFLDLRELQQHLQIDVFLAENDVVCFTSSIFPISQPLIWQKISLESHTFLPESNVPKMILHNKCAYACTCMCTCVCGHSQWWRGVLDRRKIACEPALNSFYSPSRGKKEKEKSLLK